MSSLGVNTSWPFSMKPSDPIPSLVVHGIGGTELLVSVVIVYGYEIVKSMIWKPLTPRAKASLAWIYGWLLPASLS